MAHAGALWGIALLYLIALGLVFGHGILQLQLLSARAAYRRPEFEPPDDLPFVTVQLPLYNEEHVVVDLLTSVDRLTYPTDRVEIQVLDDSTDRTAKIIEGFAATRSTDVPLHHIRRGHRHGFKAGALAHGLTTARGSVIAVFDADSRPHPDFLLRTVGAFTDDGVAAIQGRWTYVNRTESWFTRVQSVFLDVHLSIEQPGRSAVGSFINFNGTGGVWRKQAIIDAGGWSSASLTEDLDLSYRAQLAGWRILYDHDTTVPAELPPTIGAFRSQQFRWMKGVAENARLHAGSVVRSELPLIAKAHAIGHLLETMVFPAITVFALLSWPLAHLAADGAMASWLTFHAPVLGFFVVLAPLYFTPQRRLYGEGPLRFFASYVGFVLLSMGMALHHSAAALLGIFGVRSGFVRTPKRGTARRTPIAPLGWTFALDAVAWVLISAALITTVWTTGWLLGAWPLTAMYVGLTLVLLMRLAQRVHWVAFHRRPAA